MDIGKINEEILILIKSQTNIINSTQTFRQYVNNCQKRGTNDEENVVQPFTISFLKILNYINQHNLLIEEVQKGNKPDFHSEGLDCLTNLRILRIWGNEVKTCQGLESLRYLEIINNDRLKPIKYCALYD